MMTTNRPATNGPAGNHWPSTHYVRRRGTRRMWWGRVAVSGVVAALWLAALAVGTEQGARIHLGQVSAMVVSPVHAAPLAIYGLDADELDDDSDWDDDGGGDDDGYVERYGILESRPVGTEGAWVIGGVSYTATAV